MGRRSRRRGQEEQAAPAAPAARRRSGAQRDAAVRDELKPLAPGERPTPVTIAAVVAAVLALANLVAFAAGLEIRGESPNAAQVAGPALILLVAAAGMWKARYWAVLGFEAVLGILIVYLAILLPLASNVVSVLLVLVILIPASWLFWKLVRSMARLQMPRARRPRASE